MSEAISTSLEDIDPRQARVIEFFGLPGVGKTTAAHAYAKALTGQGHEVLLASTLIGDGRPFIVRAVMRFALIATELIRRPSLVEALRLSSQCGPSTLKARLKAGYNCLTTAALYARVSRRQEIVLVDQGWLQAVWSLATFSDGDPDPENIAAQAIQRFQGPDLFVILEAPLAVIRDRLSMRSSKHSRMQHGIGVELWDRALCVQSKIMQSLGPEINVSRIRWG